MPLGAAWRLAMKPASLTWRFMKPDLSTLIPTRQTSEHALQALDFVAQDDHDDLLSVSGLF
jgi:hypothetical protein